MKVYFRQALVLVLVLLFSGLIFADDGEREEFRAELDRVYKEFSVFWESGSYLKALPKAKRSYELADKVFEKGDEKILSAKYNYGIVLYKVKGYKESVEILKEVYDEYEKLYGQNSPQLVDVLTDIGKSQSGAMKVREAKSYFKKALKIVNQNEGKSVRYASILLEAGFGLLINARSKGSLTFIKQAYEIFLQEKGADHPRTGYAAFMMGKYYATLGDENKAIKFYSLAIGAWESDVGEYDSYQTVARGQLVAMYEKLGKRDKATEHCLAIGAKKPWRSTKDYQPLYKIPPIYPRLAARKGDEGHAVVEFTVNKMGFVVNPNVIELVGNAAFGDAAVDVLKKWRYAPRFENGEPVSTQGVRNIIQFRLR